MQCDIGTVARKKIRAFNCELSCPLSSGIYWKFQDNLVLTTEFITFIGHRKEFLESYFEALALTTNNARRKRQPFVSTNQGS